LDAALELGVSCGGWCPAGRLAEDGKIPDRYPVVELVNGGYAERTSQNVADSDGTLIIAHGPLTGGTRETVERCIEMQKPHLVIDCASVSIDEGIERAADFVRAVSSRAPNVLGARDPADDPSATEHSRGSLSSARPGMTTILNIAGPRASQWPDGRSIAHEILSAVLQRLSGHNCADEYSA